MPTTTKTFANLGFRTMPIGKAGYELCRDEKEKKQIVNKNGEVISFNNAMPSNWTNEYGKQRKESKDTPLGGLICGKLDNKELDEIEVIAIDCDNEAAWNLVTALDPTYLFKFKSIGKEGGTVIYELCKELYDMPQFSIDNGALKLEYMAKRRSGPNAMIYLPTTANKTKEQIAKGAELKEAPEVIIALLKSLEPREIQGTISAPTELAPSTLLPFNAPLVKQYVLEAKAAAKGQQAYGKLPDNTKLMEKVYKVFTPKKFRSCAPYAKNGWVHPNDPELIEIGPYSEYIVGLSSIAGSDPSIDIELYVDFMQAINAQLDDPYPIDRYLTEVLNPMTQGKAKINGKAIWRYNENWDKDSHTVVNQYGDTLEYFANEEAPNEFLEYNHTTNAIVRTTSVSALLDRIYTMDSSPNTDKPSRSIVKKLKLVREEHSVRLAPGIFVNGEGRTIINTEKAVLPLQILRHPDLYPDEVNEYNKYVQAFNVFLAHLLDDDETSIEFMKQLLAYHGRHLEAMPVIIYMVGVGGAGKSQFAQILETLYGSNVTRRPNAQQLTGRFNDFLENCALLVLSETSDTAYREQEGIKAVLKTVTGERSIDIESKMRPLKPNVPMFALPLLLANEPWYKEDTADRRLFSLMPSETLINSERIKEFETAHGVRVVDFIIEGIRKGILAKYISSFCPEQLPPVPMTESKQALSEAQSDPIAHVKSLVQNKRWHKLFDLFDEYEIESFFHIMNADESHLKLKYYLYREHLVDLVKAMREGAVYPSDKTISSAFTPARWLETKNIISANTRSAGLNSYKKVGRYRWACDNLLESYEEWQIKQLQDED